MTYAPGQKESEVEILPLLLADHQHVASLLGRFDGIAAGERRALFDELVPTLIGHEVAEEEILYPAIRAVSSAAEPVVKQRIEEQAAAEALLKSMEKLDPAGDEFASSLAKLRSAVLEHAESEERSVFLLLDEFDEVLDRPTMGVRYLQAKAAAPTHPHPHAPDAPPGDILLGPVAAIADRVRDALR